MRAHHIAAILLRQIAQSLQAVELAETIYYIAFDVFFFGFFGIAVGKLMGNQRWDLVIMTAVITARPLFARLAVTISKHFNDELTQTTLVAHFASPLTFAEFLIASTLSSLALGIFGATLGYTLIVNILNYDMQLLNQAILTALIPLLISGITLGLCMICLGLLFGKKNAIWQSSICWLVAGLGALYFPLAALPSGLQTIARALPVTYIFEGLRAQLFYGQSAAPFLTKCFELNVLYLIVAVITLHLAFKRAKSRGLNRLEVEL